MDRIPNSIIVGVPLLIGAILAIWVTVDAINVQSKCEAQGGVIVGRGWTCIERGATIDTD
jgi:hypothetical protein